MVSAPPGACERRGLPASEFAACACRPQAMRRAGAARVRPFFDQSISYINRVHPPPCLTLLKLPIHLPCLTLLKLLTTYLASHHSLLEASSTLMGMDTGMGMEVLPMSPAGSSAVTTGDLRRGAWTAEEDLLLVNYISQHGEGRWNSLARCAGLRRTGKSCRLRWLNYLRPDVRRGDITPEEQLLILDLHSRWGNRWSKIAQHLPGRTDNDIKNYWRTRVQKHARQLGCDVNSDRFRQVIRLVWMPRLLERIEAESSSAAAASKEVAPPAGASQYHCFDHTSSACRTVAAPMSPVTSSSLQFSLSSAEASHGRHLPAWGASAATANIDGSMMQSPRGEGGVIGGDHHVIHGDSLSGSWSELLAATDVPVFEFRDFTDNLWSLEDIYG